MTAECSGVKSLLMCVHKMSVSCHSYIFCEISAVKSFPVISSISGLLGFNDLDLPLVFV